MKRFIKILSVFILLITLVGCFDFLPGNEENGSNNNIQIEDSSKNLAIFLVDGEIFKQIEVEKNQAPDIVNAPIKEDYEFLGWFLESGMKYEYTVLESKITFFYSKYKLINSEELEEVVDPSLEFINLINHISTEVIKSSVKVYATSYNTGFFGAITSSYISQGSGIIFDFSQSSNTYYVLTNAHVASKRSSYDYIKYEVEDYKGNLLTAYLHLNAIDINYDLAILKFTKSTEDLSLIALANENPVFGDIVISLGSPKKQNNSITFGKVLRYTKITTKDTTYSDVKFDVIQHNTPVKSGSSGGALINTEFQLIGLNYAMHETEDGEFSSAYSIPILKIKEFLALHSL